MRTIHFSSEISHFACRKLISANFVPTLPVYYFATMSKSPEKQPLPPLGAFVIDPLQSPVQNKQKEAHYPAEAKSQELPNMLHVHSEVSKSCPAAGCKDYTEVLNTENPSESLKDDFLSVESNESETDKRNNLASHSSEYVTRLFGQKHETPLFCASGRANTSSEGACLDSSIDEREKSFKDPIRQSQEGKSSDSDNGKSVGVMLKLLASGARGLKFDQKKTVLPVSLLRGVTELVKKQQVCANSTTNQLNISNNSLQSSATELKTGCVTSTETKNGGDELFENVASGSVKYKAKLISETITEISPGQQIQLNSAAIASLQSSKSEVIEHSDLCTVLNCIDADLSSKETFRDSNLLTENQIESESEFNNIASVDIDSLACDKMATSDNVDKAHGESEDSSGEVVDELLQIDKDVIDGGTVKPTDVVYNLSDLFSGELERRWKWEQRRLKKRQNKLAKFSKNKKKRPLEENEDDSEAVEKPSKKKTPNYFVAIQIKDKQIKDALQKVQNAVVAGNKQLKAAINNISTLHLTMSVLCLDSEEEINKSKLALDKASEKLLPSYTDAPLALDISGLGHFRNEVVFAKVKTEQQVLSLKSIAETVENCFLDQDIVSPDKRGFKPHITIMKLSKMKRAKKKKGTKKIAEDLYKDFVSLDFGSEAASVLQLCAMMKAKDEHGYYQVEHSVFFAKCPSEATDTSTSRNKAVADEMQADVKPIKKDQPEDVIPEDAFDQNLDTRLGTTEENWEKLADDHPTDVIPEDAFDQNFDSHLETCTTEENQEILTKNIRGLDKSVNASLETTVSSNIVELSNAAVEVSDNAGENSCSVFDSVEIAHDKMLSNEHTDLEHCEKTSITGVISSEAHDEDIVKD